MIPPRPTKLGPRAAPALPGPAERAPSAGPVGLRARRFGASPARERGSADDQAGLSGVLFFISSNMAYLAAATAVVAHLLFAVEEHSFAVRLLTAVPAVVLILETRHFLKNEAGELPFVTFALLQYYAAFGLGVFFGLKFFDLRGPVIFTAQARLSGAAAVALGAVSIWAAARLGRRVGSDIEPWVIRAMPRAELPERWDKALLTYAGVAVFVALVFTFAAQIVPMALWLPMTYLFSLDFVMGLAIVAPPRRTGPLLSQALLFTITTLGLLHGSLDPVFRGVISYISGRWAMVRKVSWRLMLAVIAIFAIVQPVKGAYRQQVWTGRQTGTMERVDAWKNALTTDVEEDRSEATISRISELGAVMHAFDVLPNRVDFLNGAGFLPVLYSPIPRVLWPNKPTTQETVQRYAITFGRQSEVGARTTAINLPLLVEGYWNFGWAGIVFGCGALGLWVGMSQRLFASRHWAMRATGIANITVLSVAGPVVYVYNTVFQLVSARIIVCWAIFWLAKALSRREYERPQFTSRSALRR